MSPVSFIDSPCTTRVEYEAWLKAGGTMHGQGSVKVRGMPVSGNVIPAVLLAQYLKCGDMEMMNIMEGALHVSIVTQMAHIDLID